MGLLNPSFEDEGALPGEAAHWTMSAFTGREVIAGFGSAPELAWEDFERWLALFDGLEDVTVALAMFGADAVGYDAFEDGWSNAIYLFDLPPGQLAVCAFGGGAVEDCEGGWANGFYARDWANVSAVEGVFDGESREDFEDQWRSNESYAWVWTGVASSAAAFKGNQSAETFEGTWTAAKTV